METPRDDAGRQTERIMVAIEKHLQPTVNYGAPPHVHHYNRAYEAVYRILSEDDGSKK